MDFSFIDFGKRPGTESCGTPALVAIVVEAMKGYVFPLVVALGVLPVVSAPSDEAFEKASGIYDEAKSSKDPETMREKLLSAIPLLEKFAEDFPDNPEVPKALYRSGVAKLMTGGREEAEITFNRVLEVSGGKGDFAGMTAFRMGSLALNEKEFETAVPFFKTASEECENPDLRYRSLNSLTQCYLSMKQVTKAEEILRILVEADQPENRFRSRAKLALAHILVTGDRKEEAEAIYRELAAEDADEVGKDAESALKELEAAEEEETE